MRVYIPYCQKFHRTKILPNLGHTQAWIAEIFHDMDSAPEKTYDGYIIGRYGKFIYDVRSRHLLLKG